jgi:hypothetical protein
MKSATYGHLAEMLNYGARIAPQAKKIALIIDEQFTTGDQVQIPIDVYGEEENKRPKWGLACEDLDPPKGYYPAQYCTDLTRNVMKGAYYPSQHEAYAAFLECLSRLKKEHPRALVATFSWNEWTSEKLLELARQSVESFLQGKASNGIHYFVRWRAFLDQGEDSNELIAFARKIAAKHGFIALPLINNGEDHLAFVGKESLIQVQRHRHLVPAIEYLIGVR